MKTTFFLGLIGLISISVGLTVFSLAWMRYSSLDSQGPYSYEVEYSDGVQTTDLGVSVRLNLSRFPDTWFFDEDKNVNLDVSMERHSGLVQSFSWRIFWVELFTFEDRAWHIVATGSDFLNTTESSNLRLHRSQDIPVGIVNLNYFESVDRAWFRISIMMEVRYNNTTYSFTFYTPQGEIGPVSILSPLYSPASLAIVSTAATALSGTIVRQLLGKRNQISKKTTLFS